jgi:signal transduction histidine kinase
VRADRDKAHQVLLNLLDNALKFTPAGGSVLVRAAPSLASTALVGLEVRDSGIGIAADKLEAIFDPFVQLGGNNASQREGVGLGLSISRTLARGMGGDLSAMSSPGAGSSLTLVLPRA